MPETPLSLEYKRKAKERVDALIAAGDWSKLTIRERLDNLIEVAHAYRDKYADNHDTASWEEVTFIIDIAEFINDASTDDPLESYREEI